MTAKSVLLHPQGLSGG